MCVLSLIDLPVAVPLGCFTGQTGAQAVLEELNNSWRNSGSGVIFGQDSFGDKFRAFSEMVTNQITDIKNTVVKTIEAVCCPNKVIEVCSMEDLENITACMYLPILTMPEVRPLFESGRIDGWGVKAQDLPEEDVVGRLLKNGRFCTGDEDYDRNADVKIIYKSDDPTYDFEQLRNIRTTREFICSFLEEQLGPEGEELDFTNLPNRMKKAH